MRVLACLRKTFLENLREWKVLVLVLVFAPAFVYMMKGYFGAAAPAYGLLVVNHDVDGPAAPASTPETRGLVDAWRAARHPDGKPVFTVTEVTDLDAARDRVKTRDADLVVEIPAGFARKLADYRDRRTGPPALLVNHADEKNLRSSMAMAMSDYAAFSYAAVFTRATMPLDVSVRPLGSGRPLTEFDLYVPALLVLAIIMVLFSAAASLVREVEKGTMTRLLLSKLRTGELLAAVAVNQVLLGLTALLLAYLAAVSCGYRGEGSLVSLLVVGAAGTLGVVALAVLVAAFLKSMFELLTVGTFPFFVLMFFSEAMFPLPKIPMLQIGGHVLYANDMLPTTLCVRAFNRILNFGAGLGDVGFELAVILFLTALYGALGTWLFHRRHLRV